MFCEHCGKKLEEHELCDCPEARAEQEAAKAVKKPEEPKPASGKSKKGLFIAVGIIAVVVIIAIVFLMSRPEKVDLGTYLNDEIEVVGFDGHARVDTEDVFDSSALESDLYKSAMTGSSIDSDEAADMTEEDFAASIAGAASTMDETSKAYKAVKEKLSVSYYVNDKEVKELTNLANGDTVKIVASADDYVIEDLNMKLVDGETIIEVMDLDEGKELDLFGDYISIKVSGSNGSGTVEVERIKGTELPVPMEFYIESNGTFKNGDTAVIEADYDFEALTAAGYYLAEDKIDYAVEGLGDAITSNDAMPEDLRAALKEKGIEILNSDNPANYMDDNDASSKVSYYKMYMASTEDTNAQYKNIVFVLGSYKQKDTGETRYCFCCLCDPSILEDGTYVVEGKTNLSDVDANAIGGYTKTEIEDISARLKQVGFNESYDIVEI